VDPTILSSGVVAGLVTFFQRTATRTLESGSDAASQAVIARLKTLYGALKTRLAGDAAESRALDRLEEQPTSTARQRVLEGVLIEAIEQDPTFAGEIARLLADAERDGARMSVADSGAVAGGDLHQRGQYIAGRDLTLNPPPPPPA
jgi:hypothetical protein